MAEVDPRIRQFNEQAQQALAAVQRANAEARTLQAQIEKDAAAEERVAQRVGSRAVQEEPAAAEAATQRVSRQASTRTRALTDEEAVQARLNKVRAQGTVELDAQAAAYRNVQRYGPFAGGRRNFQQFGYGGGAGGVPPIPPGGKLPPPGGFPALPAPGLPPTVVGSSHDELAGFYTRARAEADSYRLSVSKLAQEQNVASVAMHRHGALTTEFITAAQRGEVTIRELGYQTASTIGKFGGWLVAGSAVYGAFAAISKLGKGALDAYSGVNLLSRVVTEGIDAPRLRQEFSDLAGEFNLPIETVTEAAYQMGKVFHSQNGALAASRAVLYSVKVGELDVASATRYLIAIVNGFHLPASKMAEVFDQINAAQNRFGISIADVEAGLAKAGGTFHAAGGDFSHLLAIITTAQKATGNTGQVVGTAIARAPNFLRKAANQDILRQFGIAPGQSIDKIITEAFEVSQHLSGTKLQELAAAIFGPQYGARIGTPLLQQKDLYDKVLRRTSPQAAKGSAERELQTQLSGVNEQIAQIGVSFERLGGQLANAHAFDAVGGLIKLLNETLTLALGITETFNTLPDPLKQSLVYLLQMSIAVRTLRRFQLGESIAGGSTARPTGARGFLANVFDRGPIGEARLFRGGLYEEQKQLEEQRASVTSQISKHAGLSDAARQSYLAELDRNQVLSTQMQGGTQKARDAWERSNASLESYRNEMIRNAGIVDQLRVQSTYTDQRLKQVNESLARTRRYGFFNVNAALAERERTTGVQYYPTTAARPAGIENVATGAGRSVVEQAGGIRELPPLMLPANAEQQMQQAEAQVTREGARVGRLRGLAGAVGDASNRLLNRVGTLFFGFSIGLMLKSILDSVIENIDNQRADIERAAPSAEKLRDLAHREAGGHGGLTSTIADFFTGSGVAGAPFRLLEDAGLPTLPGLLGHPSGKGIADELTEAEQQAITAAKDTLALQRKQRERGEPQMFRYSAQLQHSIKDVLKSNRTKADKLRELDRIEKENELSAEAGNVPGRKDQHKVKAVEQSIEIARAQLGNVKELSDTLDKLDPKVVQSWMDDYTQLIEGISGDFNMHAFRRAAAIYSYQVQRLGHSHNPDDLKELAKDQEAFYEAITQAVNDEVTKGFLLAETPGDRLRIAQRALHTLRSTLATDPAKAVREQRAEVEKAKRKLEEAERQQRQFEGQNQTVFGQRLPFNIGKSGANDQDIKRLQTALKSQKEHLSSLRKDARERGKFLEQAEKELRQQIYEAVSAIRDARFEYRSSQTADPLRQTRLELEKINTDLAGAIKAYGRDSAEVYGLLAQREQALQQLSQDQLSLIQARGNLNEAGFFSYQTVAKDRAALANLQRQLGFEQAHQNAFSPQEIIELEAQVRGAEVQLTEDIQREAKELVDAAFGVKIAKAKAGGHDVRAIELELRRARYDLGKAKTPLEKLQAQEQIVGLVAQKRDAVARRRLENIEFEADINKITTQQEITQLEQLLHDYKLSRDLRRQIREQIHSLKQDSGFDLDVGSITLPTVYDIRRAIQGGISGNPRVNVTNAPTVVINNYAADPNAVGHAVGQALGGPTKAALRSAGLGG